MEMAETKKKSGAHTRKKSAGTKASTTKKSPAKKTTKTTKTSSRKYGKSASDSVKKEMHAFKKGKAHSGPQKKPVKSRKQAIAIALSKARKKGAKVPKKAGK